MSSELKVGSPAWKKQLMSKQMDSNYQVPAQRSMSLSVSKINDFFQCTELFQAKHIHKRIPFVETEATAKGKLLHKWCELTIKEGEHIIPEAPQGVLNEFTIDILKKIITAPGTAKDSEFMLGINTSLTEATKVNNLWDKQTDGQPYGIMLAMDARVANGAYVTHIDWKTGKVYEPFLGKERKFVQISDIQKAIKQKELQMDVYALAEFLYNPECQYIKSIYAFTEYGKPQPLLYTRAEDFNRIRTYLLDAIKMIWFNIESWRSGASVAGANVTPLCGWCGIREECIPYNRKLGAI